MYDCGTPSASCNRFMVPIGGCERFFSMATRAFCDMPQNALVDIEKNRSQPPMGTMKRLQEVLGVPQSYILLYSIEDSDIPEDKLKTAKHLLTPLKDYLLREDF